MPIVVRTSIVAVLALVGSLLGVLPAHAVPPGSTPLFAAGPSETAVALRPLGQTAAGLVYKQSTTPGTWVKRTGGAPEHETGIDGMYAAGGLFFDHEFAERAVVWRTISDSTVRTHALTVGENLLGPAPGGYLAARGSGPYQLVRVQLSTGSITVIGTSNFPFTNAQASSAGVIAQDDRANPTGYLWFPNGSSGPGTFVPYPANSSYCVLAGTFLYCPTSVGSGGVTRVSLTSGATASAAVFPHTVVETSTGAAFTGTSAAAGGGEQFSLWNWPTSSATPTRRADDGVDASSAVAPGVPGTVLVSRNGPLGQAGIWSVPLPTGAPTLLQAGPAQDRAARRVALAPGQVAWADNHRYDGAVWSRDLDAAGAPTSPARLVSSNASATTLSLSGDRFTFTESSDPQGRTRLIDGPSRTLLEGFGTESVLSGDRLLHLGHVTDGVGASRPVWTLRDLRSGTNTTLPAAVSYDLWGERLARLEANGSVWVSDLRAGTAPVLVRSASVNEFLYGTVHIAGDTVAWNVHWGDDAGSSNEIRTRNVSTLAPATDVTGFRSIEDLSTGYAFANGCIAGCGSAAISLSTGQTTPFTDVGAAAVDGNLVAYLDRDQIPHVVALPAYADAPRLLAAPGAVLSMASGQDWSVRVVASRVLSACAVVIRDATDALVRSLPCTDSDAATTVTWDGRDATGALVPAGSYTWRITGTTGGATLVDYDGSTKALAGSIVVAAPSAPTITARSPVADGTSAAVATNVTATFSEAVQGVSATTFRLRDAAGTLVDAAVSHNATTRVATLNPGANLAPDTRYTATLTGGATAIRGTTNVPLTTTSWTFTTGPAPTATTVTPAVNGTSFAVGANPAAVFSEAVTGVGATTFTLATATGTAVPAAVTYAATTRRATLNPTADLTPDTRYTATLTGGAAAIRDAAGNPLITRSWSFTTGPAPRVTGRTPATSATGVVGTSNVTAVFSEAVQGVSGTTFRLRNPAGTAITAVVTYDASTRTATLDPGANLAAATRYTASLTGGATGIRDAAGNPLANVTWSFTTR